MNLKVIQEGEYVSIDVVNDDDESMLSLWITEQDAIDLVAQLEAVLYNNERGLH